MEHGTEIPYLAEVLTFLLAAVLVIPLARRIGLSPVVGYLAAGVVLGPFVFGLIERSEGVEALAGLGVVFLMFTIGLELSLERLWAMRRLVFGLGSGQILATGLVVGLIAFAWGNDTKTAILLGASFALSSTAVVVQLLEERGELAGAFGRRVVSVLLMQDIAVIPILFMVGLFGPAAGTGSILVELGLAFGKAVLAVVGILAAGRLLLRPFFRMVLSTHDAELFTALILLAILLTALAADTAGVPMALGAFLAGALLAETEFRHQVQADLQPFKGLLLGLFFMSVGMGIDPVAVYDRLSWLVLAALGLAALKSAVAYPLFRVFGLPAADAIRAGMLIGQSGEFVFVVVGAALVFGLMEPAVGNFMIMTAVLSMLLTPLLDVAGRRIAAHASERQRAGAVPDIKVAGELESHVVICGYGRVGQTVARVLDLCQAPYIAVDMDAGHVARLRSTGAPVVFGDCRRAEMLRRVGTGRAAAVVVTLDQPAAADEVIRAVRAEWPLKPVYARSRDRRHSEHVLALGATEAVPENLEGSLQLAGSVMTGLGAPREAVNQILQQLRDQAYDGLPTTKEPGDRKP